MADMSRFAAAAALWLAFITPALADAPSFGWPAGCTPGQDCWIAQYVDHDPTSGYRDFGCGHRSYDKHDGTDIAVKDHAAIDRDIPVIAAADGRVARIRNDQQDHFGTDADIEAAQAAKKEAGNVVSLVHSDGWVTEYAHMKKGSVTVKVGDIVKKGQRLGSVGQTGMAAFAHVHFSVRHKNAVVDPFIGEDDFDCGDAGHPLWDKPIAYEPALFYAAGFSDHAPSLEDLTRDASSPSTMPATAPQFLFWASLWGAEPDDEFTETILDPAGQVYARYHDKADKTRIKVLRVIGRDTKKFPLQPGVYTGRATFTRHLPDGKTIERSIEQSVRVTNN
jgi:murein DD-endopeptidase MepM/ murein hydrolase activator NlpD